MISIVCVLRSGGHYDLDYVLRLRTAVRAHLSEPHAFYCLSDLNGGGPNQVPVQMLTEGVRAVPLLSDWPAWWAKLEAFRIMGPVLYLDLDTAIVGSIDPLAEAITRLGADDILMLRAFRNGDWASGIMGWAGCHIWLKWLFSVSRPRFKESYAIIPTKNGDQAYRGDQEWIREQFTRRSINKVVAAQDVCPGIYSYKHHCQEVLPPDARVVCFHGRPRPTELDPSPEWLGCHRATVPEELRSGK